MARFRVALQSAVLCAVGLLGVAAFFSPPTRASAQESVRLAEGSTVALTTPPFIERGKRYAFTWPGGGPPQTFTVKEVRKDGWILVEVAEENIDLNILPLGTLPVRWLNVGIATSVQEMRPILQ